MDRTAVNNRLQQVFSEVLWGANLPVSEMTRDNTGSWDSLAHMNVILAIEEAFGIRLSDDEVLHIRSYGDALTAVSRQVAGASA